jgi:hypothetical protein
MSKIPADAALKAELNSDASGPLLPIEKTLIIWSLIIGVTMLIVLAAFNHFLPVT